MKIRPGLYVVAVVIFLNAITLCDASRLSKYLKALRGLPVGSAGSILSLPGGSAGSIPGLSTFKNLFKSGLPGLGKLAKIKKTPKVKKPPKVKTPKRRKQKTVKKEKEKKTIKGRSRTKGR